MLRALLTTLGAVLALVTVIGLGAGIRALAGRHVSAVFGLLLGAYLATMAVLWINGSLSGGHPDWDSDPYCPGPPTSAC